MSKRGDPLNKGDNIRKAVNELRAFVMEHGTDAQARSYHFATRTPATISNVPLSIHGGETRIQSFTLMDKTVTWLDGLRKGTKSKTVEVALARYRLWGLQMRLLEELIEEVEELRRRLE